MSGLQLKKVHHIAIIARDYSVSRDFYCNILGFTLMEEVYREARDSWKGDLAQGIHSLIRQHDLPRLMLQAFATLPEMKLTPHQAFQQQVKGNVETVPLSEMVGRISANMILPYPPGVPVVMPGEVITEQSRAVLDFLLMLCTIGQHYPGFETDIHGATLTDEGQYLVRVLKADAII